MDIHLSPKIVAALLAGDLPQEQERALGEHLRAGDCDQCEEGLMNLRPDKERELLAVVSRLTDPQTLHRPDSGAPSTEDRERTFRSIAWGWAPVIACAAMALLVLTMWPKNVTQDTSTQRDKGAQPSAWVPINLTVAQVAQGKDGPPTIERLGQGQQVSQGSDLVFQLRNEQACYPYLVRLAEDDSELLLPSVLSEQELVQPGKHTPRAGDNPLGSHTGDLSGKQRFVALCSLKMVEHKADILQAAKKESTDTHKSGNELWIRVMAEESGS